MKENGTRRDCSMEKECNSEQMESTTKGIEEMESPMGKADLFVLKEMFMKGTGWMGKQMVEVFTKRLMDRLMKGTGKKT